MRLIIGVVGFILLFSVNTKGQNRVWCITDSMDSIAVSQDSSILVERTKLEAFTNRYQNAKSNEVLVIPVVFHVLHKYGEERISIEQIERGLEIVNDDFAGLNSDLNGIVNEFKDIIGTANIEFRLAKIDPDGNCTTGVNYYDTDLTYMASNALKYAIKNWDPESYLNIWTVTSIESGAAAWSHYPGITPSLDGVVSIHRYIGSGHTLSHEIGHYLNLIHPWGSTNEPGVESNCDMDDNVEDTPNTLGSDGICDFSQFSCGSLDNVQNIMDYSTCDAMFTLGQVDRMRAALNAGTSNRNNLWTDANLAKTGTQEGYSSFACLPVADFSSVQNVVFVGESVDFSALENGGEALSLNWEFDGGEPAGSIEQNQTVFYNEPGLFNAKLQVFNDSGEDVLDRFNIVRVLDKEQGIIAPAIVDMEDEGFPFYAEEVQKQWIFEDKEEGNWELFNGDGNTALRILNNKNSDGDKTAVITSNINLANITNPDYIYFNWAYAQRNSDNNDELKVYVSNNGGKNWILRFTTRGKSLVTNDGALISSSEFFPQSDEWDTGSVSLAYNKDDEHLQLKFEVISDGGNAIYIDNLQIGEPATSINLLAANEKLSVYPNPAINQINVKYVIAQTGELQINIYNLLGQNVYQTKTINQQRTGVFTLNKNQLNLGNGIYFIELKSGFSKLSSRFVIAE